MADIEGPIHKSLGTKEALGGALKEALHRRREDAPGGRRTCVPAEHPESKAASSRPRLPRNELVFLTYFTTLRLTIFVRRWTVLVRQRGKEKRRKSFTELPLICMSKSARCFQI